MNSPSVAPGPSSSAKSPIPDAFTGEWQAHNTLLDIRPDGSGSFGWRDYSNTEAIAFIDLELELHVAGDSLAGKVTRSNSSDIREGAAVQVEPFKPKPHVLQIRVEGSSTTRVCDTAKVTPPSFCGA
ncbi:hypothetical protein [Streptomyces phytophilus]|uniref:hypothetical protein n=1 Tax=Streptomyces phytophilus TaxID=722715 RepID=UPI0015F07D4B|nr:hypothetical protein [Streptomyces phytophilus]